MTTWALRIYALLTRLVQPVLRRKLARRARIEAGYAVAIEERFGHYSQPPEANAQLVWLHAVSLGETRAAAVLLQALRASQPGIRVLLTHGTATGRTEGALLLQPGDVQTWQPWDTPSIVAKFLDHFKPRLVLLMETEIWPCAMAVAKARALPVVLVNARLSAASLQQALRMAPLSYPAYGALTAVYAQTEADARRFRQLGVANSHVFGNLKFDATPDPAQQAQGAAWRQALGQPVVLLASSRDGEETDFLEQIKATAGVTHAFGATENILNAPQNPTPKFLIVPRHPQRFDEVAALVVQAGLSVSRRSSWTSALAGPAKSHPALQADVWLGDSLGEMALYYAMSDVALLGGSFAPLGGQNLIEAAACGCPVVMGPHTFNFEAAASQAEACGAAQRVPSMAAGLPIARALVNAPPALADSRAAAFAFASSNRGALQRTLAALQAYLG